MNDLIATIAQFVDDLHPVLQFVAVFVIGTIPFLESYFGSVIGYVVGMGWPIALGGAVAGNALAVTAAVSLAGRIRTGKSRVERSKRRERILARVEKWGVPVASLLTPTVFAISLTAFIMAAAGLDRRAVLAWNLVSSLAWGVLMLVVVGSTLEALN
ncbi:hypothetical protein J4H86_00085 [Spiractinospora alimapuensis]|uniref:hypothetical protein n=1 Tax=Spiractinospora alimapuensis TaxID=2820884 RepID=UPI001F3DA89F|nr:hypothetical protein [Spiractinospora alimapuensis]QVQ52297.1 hypothetical protein J4H86_27020 [Spiractinospora alimapuensis]QVQ52315.1 hypothetical protein J4H86_00085 [Spiractinospora alimapuensis]